MESSLLSWAIAFLVLALISAVFGFGLVAGMSITIAKWLAIIFVILFVVSAIAHTVKRA
ncbi:TPA: DUF1328 domain-containing protein [Candidatus Woesearchaeota archaeon]|nr:DUF1328 domain-containing protein [Candidatus Woesearchaeota archaeon]